MSVKCCPLMSKPIARVGTYDNSEIETEFVPCQEENCALWVGAYEREGSKVLGSKQGCAIAIQAQRGSDGYIDV